MMIAQRRLRIHTSSAGLFLLLLGIDACSDPADPIPHRSIEPPAGVWVGHYASVLETVVVDDTPTPVQAHLDLYSSFSCRLHAEFFPEERARWTTLESSWCNYYLEPGAVTLFLKLWVHNEAGNELIDASATFEPADEDWTAVVWKEIGIRLEADMDTKG